MKIYNEIGSKNRLYEMFQKVNKLKLNEDVINAVDQNQILNQSFDALLSNNIRVQRNTTQAKGEENYVELECVDDNNNKIKFNFKITTEEGDQEGVFNIGDVILFKFSYVTSDGNELVNLDEGDLKDFNSQNEDQLRSIIDDYVDFDVEITGELGENKEIINSNDNIEQLISDKENVGDEIPGGLGDHSNPSDFDIDQLIKGIDVEMEHTDDPMIALEISIDHLRENPQYYDYLEDMENEMNDDADEDKMIDVLLGYQPLNVGDNIDESGYNKQQIVSILDNEPYKTIGMNLLKKYSAAQLKNYEHKNMDIKFRIGYAINKFLPLLKKYNNPEQIKKLIDYMYKWDTETLKSY